MSVQVGMRVRTDGLGEGPEQAGSQVRHSVENDLRLAEVGTFVSSGPPAARHGVGSALNMACNLLSWKAFSSEMRSLENMQAPPQAASGLARGAGGGPYG